MSRFWPGSEPLQVEVDARGRPHTLHWQGRIHPVESIANRWRVDTGWWQQRIWREYVKLATRSGLLVILYQDLERGDWYLHRLYD